MQFLHEHNYIIECEEIDKNYFQARIENDKIKGFMWIRFFNHRLYNGVAIDNKKCWNKLSQCPFRMKIPSPKKFNAYLERFLFWGSREGYNFSLKFDYYQFDHDGT